MLTPLSGVPADLRLIRRNTEIDACLVRVRRYR